MRLAYFSAVPWASFRQRPQEFAEWFHARMGGEVLWIEPYPVRLPRLADLRRPPSAPPQAEPPPAWLRRLRPQALPLEPLATGRGLNRALFWRRTLATVRAFCEEAPTLLAIGKPSDLALQALRQCRAACTLYDAMDDFSAFHEGRARSTAARIEAEIAQGVDIRCTSSTLLAGRLPAPVQLVPNGLAAQRFPAPRAGAGDVGFGYVGTVGAWFDWEWLAALARAFSYERIEIHGPVYHHPAAPLPANVRLCGGLPHAQAMERMRSFGVGLIPFRRTTLTDSVDPVKYYEYRGLGLPVLSTPFGEMATRGEAPGVLLTSDPARSREAIAALRAHRDAAAQVDAFRREHDWRQRFEPLAALLPARA